MGLTLLLLMPAVNAASGLTRVFAHGALYGLIAYGTYDLTNHATHREWPLGDITKCCGWEFWGLHPEGIG